MPKSFGLPCGRKDCKGRCRVQSVAHSIKDTYLRRVRVCRVCGWRRRTVETFVDVQPENGLRGCAIRGD